ncbi:MAG: hypothetical protein P8M79_11745 [Alphaproteobacteria bacterium]|nr:hypothetical protein [Alphaproteobacteria bacterium]
MPDTPDMEDLARRYMDLWQEHLNTLASDQDTTKVMAQTMAMMSSSAQAFADIASASAWPSRESGNDCAPDRSPSTTPSDSDADPDVAELRRRVAALEERVAELESETAGRGSASSKGRRKNKS